MQAEEGPPQCSLAAVHIQSTSTGQLAPMFSVLSLIFSCSNHGHNKHIRKHTPSMATNIFTAFPPPVDIDTRASSLSDVCLHAATFRRSHVAEDRRM
jgi:hypothetical protein